MPNDSNDSKFIQITNLTISNAEQNIELSLGARRESQSPFKKAIFEQTHLNPTHSRKKLLKNILGLQLHALQTQIYIYDNKNTRQTSLT